VFFPLRLPISRPVKRVDIIRIMLSQSQQEMRVPLGDGVHVIRRRTPKPDATKQQ